MHNMFFPNIDTRAVMNEIRFNLTQLHENPDSFLFDNELNNNSNINELIKNISKAQEHAAVGSELPSMSQMKGIRRKIATFVGNIALRIGQIFTRDQRIFNQSLIDSLSLIFQEFHSQEQKLQYILNQVSKPLNLELTRFEETINQEIKTSKEQLRNELEAKDKLINSLDQHISLEVENIKNQLNDEVQNVKNFKGDIREEIVKITNQFESECIKNFSHINNQVEFIKEQVDKILSTQNLLKTQIRLQERRLTLLLEEARKRLPQPFNDKQLGTFSDALEEINDSFYLAFEDQFRGSRQEIKERVKVYLPVVMEAGAGTLERPILDIGSGRGEWLELLGENGFFAKGVDMNQVMVEQCCEQGLNVSAADLFDYFSGVPDQSIGAITVFHVVEHLQFQRLVNLLDEIVRVLKPGGVAIIETPNPQNVLVGSCYFYSDPSHKNPIFPETLQFLAEYRGLTRVEIKMLNPMEDWYLPEDGSLVNRKFNEFFFGPQDYAILGWKV